MSSFGYKFSEKRTESKRGTNQKLTEGKIGNSIS